MSDSSRAALRPPRSRHGPPPRRPYRRRARLRRGARFHPRRPPRRRRRDRHGCSGPGPTLPLPSSTLFDSHPPAKGRRATRRPPLQGPCPSPRAVPLSKGRAAHGPRSRARRPPASYSCGAAARWPPRAASREIAAAPGAGSSRFAGPAVDAAPILQRIAAAGGARAPQRAGQRRPRRRRRRGRRCARRRRRQRRASGRRRRWAARPGRSRPGRLRQGRSDTGRRRCCDRYGCI